MAAIWVIVKQWAGGAVVQYLAMAAAAVIGLAILKHEFVGPYKAENADLRLASKQKDAIIVADTAQQLLDSAAADTEKAHLNDTIAKLTTDACKPDAAQLERLRKL